MLSKVVGKVLNGLAQCGLTQRLRQGIVIRYHKKRSNFDKTTCIPDWLPRQRAYSKFRKPRQPEWDDPEVIYPKLIPPAFPPVAYKHYVKNTIEAQEKERLLRTKEYLISDIRSGDIVDITYQETFENTQRVVYRCYVLGMRRKRSLSAAIEVAIRFGGTSLKAVFLIHCPRVINIQVVSRGSGMFKSNLKHNWKKLGKTQLLNPRIKKRVMKARGGRKKKVVQNEKQGLKRDEIKSDSIKRILR